MIGNDYIVAGGDDNIVTVWKRGGEKVGRQQLHQSHCLNPVEISIVGGAWGVPPRGEEVPPAPLEWR